MKKTSQRRVITRRMTKTRKKEVKQSRKQDYKVRLKVFKKNMKILEIM